jgi:hypothetical protein
LFGAEKKFAVDQEELAFGVVEDEGDGGGVHEGVDGAEDGTGQRDAVMGFEGGRAVGGEESDRLAGEHAGGADGGGQAAATVGELGVGPAMGVVGDGGFVGENALGAAQIGEGRKRDIVSGGFGKIVCEDVGHGGFLPLVGWRGVVRGRVGQMGGGVKWRRSHICG